MAYAVKTTPAGHTVPGRTLGSTVRTVGVHLMRYDRWGWAEIAGVQAARW